MDLFMLDTDPLITTLHQLVHHPNPHPDSDLPRKVKRQRRESRDNEERPRHVTIATPVDVKDTKDAYLFLADVPGLRKSDIEVLIENENVLTMRGKRKSDGKEDGVDDTKYIRMERSPVKLMRKFTLPSDAKADGITANCVDGVLTVTVPKVPPPEPEKPKTIQIAVS
jgi:HSP20 family protein